jgi:hypothetical protein
MTSVQRSASANHQRHEQQILDLLGEGRLVTQRSLSSDLGIALGLTNLLMRRLVTKGWVRIKHVSPRRMRYLITPAGLAAKAQLTRQYFLSRLGFYRDCRRHVRDRFLELTEELRGRNETSPMGIVFFGAGEVAEVAYVCLQETPLHLLGVIDENRSGGFFHVAVHSLADLAGGALAGQPFSKLVVMPTDDESETRRALAARDVPSELIFWL